MTYQSAHELLTASYHNVMSWLHFAEAKNAALITFNSGAIFAIGTAYTQMNSVPQWLCIAMLAACSILGLSLVVGFSSFFPRLTLLPGAGAPKANSGNNIWYFGHIAEMGVDTYLQELARKSGSTLAFSEIDRDLAQQIVVNSTIAVTKYGIFRISLWITLCALASPMVALLIYWFFIDHAL